jgi:hypothetical protein
VVFAVNMLTPGTRKPIGPNTMLTILTILTILTTPTILTTIKWADGRHVVRNTK